MSNAYHGQRPPPAAPRPQKPPPAQGVITAMVEARTAALTPRSNTCGMAQANMRAQLERDGLTPRTDPGAGMSPARASMARILAADGMKPAA